MTPKNEALDNLSKFLDSPEGKAHMEEYFGKINRVEAMHHSQIERFWAKYCNNLDEIVEKVIAKYKSKKYRDSWYGRGIEPPETLFYFLHDVAQEYGREYTRAEYEAMENNMFTSDVYVLGDWTFELIMGQGSAILIDKYKPNEADNDR